MNKPISINALLNHVNRAKLLTNLKELNPDIMVAMVDNDTDMPLIQEFRRELPSTLVIGRVYVDDGKGNSIEGAFHTKPDNGNEWLASPNDCLNRWGELGKNGGVLYLLNEPGTSDSINVTRLVEWTCQVIELAHQRGIRLCVLNFSTGTPEVKNDQWDERFDPVLRLLSKYREQLLGAHEYDPPSGRTGRIEAMFKRCEVLGIRPPNVALTETSWDKGDGDPDGLNGYKSRGLNGAQLVNRRVQVWQTTYSKHPEIIGEAVFCAGRTWPNFDVQDDELFWSTLKAIPPMGQTTPPVITPIPNPPIPVDIGEPIEVTVAESDWKVRAEATKQSRSIGELVKGERILMYPLSVKPADGFNWYVVQRPNRPDISRLDAEWGWSAYALPVPEPLPVPIPPPPVETFPAEPPTAPGLELVYPFPAGTTIEIAEAIAKMFSKAYVREVKKAS